MHFTVYSRRLKSASGMLQKRNLKNQIIYITYNHIYIYTLRMFEFKNWNLQIRPEMFFVLWPEMNFITFPDQMMRTTGNFQTFLSLPILKTSFYTILYISYLLYRVAEGHSVYIITYKKYWHLQNYFTITLSFIHYTVYRNTGIHYTVYIML